MNKKLLKSVFAGLCALTVFLGGNSFSAYGANVIDSNPNIGKQVLSPEDGWKRYDDNDPNIIYTGKFKGVSTEKVYRGRRHALGKNASTEYIKFSFYGSKIRLIDYVATNRTKNSEISFDNGVTFEKCSPYGPTSKSQSIFYEKTDLEKKVHDVIIRVPAEPSLEKVFCLDAIDIDYDGYFVQQYDSVNSSNITDNDRNNPNLGKSFKTPEEGWERFDDTDANVKYNGVFTYNTNTNYYKGGRHQMTYTGSLTNNGYITFSFYGTSLRLIDYVYNTRCKDCRISVDGGKTFEKFSQFGVNSKARAIFYEKVGLDNTLHNVIIEIPYNDENKKLAFALDAIDINKGGYLAPAYNNLIKKDTLNLNLSNINLPVGQSINLVPEVNCAGYTANNIVWNSSNNKVSVDTDGKVTAKEEGEAVVKACIPNTDYIALCLVKVTAAEVNPDPQPKPQPDPIEPIKVNGLKPHEYLGDMKDILVALINTDKFRAADTNRGTAMEMADFINTFDRYMLNV